MKTKDILLNLRKNNKLSQDDFAEQIHVTRQAVSRWENGDTMPSIDTLKMIAEHFHVSVDYLLGQQICQSCGMPLEKDSDRGTEQDGRFSEEYCTYCYQKGAFTQTITMEEQVQENLKALDEWNKENGTSFTSQESEEMLMEFLPTLKRWDKTY